MKKLSILLVLCCILVGCAPIEKTAYQTVVGAKAFLDTVKAKHPECGAIGNQNSDTCSYLVKATAAKDIIIDAAEIYCASTNFDKGMQCTPPTDPTVKDQAVAKLNAAITEYNQVETSLRAVLK